MTKILATIVMTIVTAGHDQCLVHSAITLWLSCPCAITLMTVFLFLVMRTPGAIGITLPLGNAAVTLEASVQSPIMTALPFAFDTFTGKGSVGGVGAISSIQCGIGGVGAMGSNDAIQGAIGDFGRDNVSAIGTISSI